ncbi:MAG: hypothetical protein H8E37_10645 [Planctomycetes bacterium]|nr:hypothetical protein [Planctomycetota bacterium]
MKPLFKFGSLLFVVLVVLPLLLRFGLFVNGLRTFHSRIGWEASEYFKDPEVVALCEAIESDNLEEIDRLVASGADVNAKGKDGMTPLLWAFPDDRLPRFEKMLELGANPNVPITGDLNSRGTFRPSMTVIHIAAGSKFEGQFEAVMKHGGDPNLVDDRDQAPLNLIVGSFSLPESLRLKRIRILLDAGADLDFVGGMSGMTSAMNSVSRGKFQEALLLLEAGASMDIYQTRSNKKFVHCLAQNRSTPNRERLDKGMSSQNRIALETILKLVKDNGDDLEQAKKDLERWQNWGKVYESAKFRELMDKEIAERKSKEAAATEQVLD